MILDALPVSNRLSRNNRNAVRINSSRLLFLEFFLCTTVFMEWAPILRTLTPCFALFDPIVNGFLEQSFIGILWPTSDRVTFLRAKILFAIARLLPLPCTSCSLAGNLRVGLPAQNQFHRPNPCTSVHRRPKVMLQVAPPQDRPSAHLHADNGSAVRDALRGTISGRYGMRHGTKLFTVLQESAIPYYKPRATYRYNHVIPNQSSPCV